MLVRFLTLLIVALGTAGAVGEEFPGIEELMDSEEYQAAGLNKLSDAEREVLNAWLLRYTAGEAEVMRRTNEQVKETEQAIEITANIKPPFKGWSGNTVFYLDNGQIWRQRLDGRFAYNGDETAVVVDKNFFGFYRLTHVASGNAVGVSRVQ